jgi:hypothetical protein
MGFGGLGAVVAGGLATLPLFSKLLPNSVGGYAFPPLGEIDSFARLTTIGFIFVATYVVYLLQGSSEQSRRRLALILWLVAFVGCAIYLAVATRFIRIVAIPTLHDSVAVSVGFERTPFAKSIGEASDFDLLRLRGPQEEEIQKLWTFRSLALARLALWTLHCGVILAFVAIFSLGALEHARQPDKTSSPRA